jgi:diaminopimelate epimerase
MCGNGLRCVALVIAHREGVTCLEVDTDAGTRACVIVEAGEGGRTGRVRVDMGPARDGGEHRPKAAPHLVFRAVSVGNPHAAAPAPADADPATLVRNLGPWVEHDEAFPGGTNVEFWRAEPDGSLSVWVWERGCGITQACGTGACAAAVAARLEGAVAAGEPLLVRLPGGEMIVRVPEDPAEGVEMTGPARVVFSGRAFPAELAVSRDSRSR